MGLHHIEPLRFTERQSGVAAPGKRDSCAGVSSASAVCFGRAHPWGGSARRPGQV